MAKIMVCRGVTALREAAYGTDAGISTSNGVEFTEATVQVQDTYDGLRADVHHGSGGSLPPTVSAGRFADITVRGELKGPGVAYTAALTDLPWYNIALGCAMSGVVAAGNLTLSPVRPDKSGSFTMGLYSGDQYYKLTGCRGNIRFTGNAAERGEWEFTGQGIVAPSYPTQVAMPALTYANSGDLPPVFTSGSATYGAWTPVIRSYEFDTGNEMTPRLDGNAATGHAGFEITNRATTWSFPGEVVSLDTFDPYSTSISGTTAALSLTHGASTGNTFVFAMAKASIRPPDMTDDNGIVMWGVGGVAHITSGNDEFTVTMS